MDNSLLKIERHGKIEVLTLQRAEKLNALSTELLLSLKTHLQNLGEKFPDTAGLMILGKGEKAFVAGADIAQMNLMSPEQGRGFAALAQEVTQLLEELHCPVIAAVDGFALGGGCELAMACDFIYATEKSQFGQPEVNLGLIPGFGGCVRLQRFVGLSQAREMIYTGKSIDAFEAHKMGLVSRVFPTRTQMVEAALETLQLISQKPVFAVSVAKRILNAQHGRSTKEGLQAELDGFEEVFRHPNKAEGVRAFLEKRKAHFDPDAS